MDRSRSISHVFCLMLAVVLAWPWYVSLAAAESSSVPTATNQAAWVARGGQRARQVGRFGKWCQASCPAVIPDYEEDDSEEGDDLGVLHPWALLTLPAALPGTVALPSGGVANLAPRTTLRLSALCRFRC